ncbi:MAG: L-threonylcarbamoyladenylate synthase [Oscillospiraceae bacterium]|nr:L-threonylcarbamoyladenylate synthase [Oscillospiraceae bacterium]
MAEKEKETKILRVRNIYDDMENMQTAAEILAGGGLVAFPTETVYGLGANALDERAVAAIFRAKGRPQDNPLIVHVCDLDMIGPLVAEVPEAAIELAGRFWPGPLTMIFRKSDAVPAVTSGGLDTVAIRFPSHMVARELIRRADVPIAAPSANLSGSPSPTTAQHCIHDLMGRVDAIVDSGSCGVGVESTVISLAGEKPRVLRPGGVTVEQLREALGDVEVDPAVCAPLADGVQAASPGMKYKHYAPRAHVVILRGGREAFAAYVNAHRDGKTYAMCFEEDVPALGVPYVVYGGERDDASQAAHLFSALREMDELGAETVYAHCPARTGVGLAVYNRLLRAAAFEVIEL